MDTPLREIRDALLLFAGERRAHVRLTPVELQTPVLARLKHGPQLTLVDLSAGGALIETPARLNPGAHFVLEFLAGGAQHATTVRSRVLRSHVASLKGGLTYRGGFAFRDLLQLAELSLPRAEEVIPPTEAPALAGAMANLRSVASSARDREVTRLLDEVLQKVQPGASPRALMAFVEERLRARVPLLSVSYGPGPRPASQTNEALSFDLGRTHVDFRPARRLTEEQVRLVHTAASVMTLIQGWRARDSSAA